MRPHSDSGVLRTRFPADWIAATKGYIGYGMLTPIRKPQFHRDLLDWEKELQQGGGQDSLFG